MSEKMQILFMQTRMIRLASEEWQMSIQEVSKLFRTFDVLKYIETGYDIFRCEGDMAVLYDITSYLKKKGAMICA